MLSGEKLYASVHRWGIKATMGRLKKAVKETDSGSSPSSSLYNQSLQSTAYRHPTANMSAQEREGERRKRGAELMKRKKKKNDGGEEWETSFWQAVLYTLLQWSMSPHKGSSCPHFDCLCSKAEHKKKGKQPEDAGGGGWGVKGGKQI